LKSFLIALAVLFSGSTLSLFPLDAEAKRLAKGKSAGMQRQIPPKQPEAAPTQAANAATPAAAPAAAGTAGAAAAAGKRSWLGPIAGLAAGLGIAALLSQMGFGEGLANLVTMLLIAAVAFFAIRWLMGRMGKRSAPTRATTGNLHYAGASAGAGANAGGLMRTPDAATTGLTFRSAEPTPAVGSGVAGSFGSGSRPQLQPEGFDAAAFERIAKMIFIRLQAANDSGQVDDLRRFTTPELFASLRLDLQERGDAGQQTDVIELQAQVIDTAQEDGQWIVSVRFHGLIRETADALPEPFDELWHLVKPVEGDREWAIAGITSQTA
jgi:predicted lipid-binding transport protein (Tim44 family)